MYATIADAVSGDLLLQLARQEVEAIIERIRHGNVSNEELLQLARHGVAPAIKRIGGLHRLGDDDIAAILRSDAPESVIKDAIKEAERRIKAKYIRMSRKRLLNLIALLRKRGDSSELLRLANIAAAKQMRQLRVRGHGRRNRNRRA